MALALASGGVDRRRRASLIRAGAPGHDTTVTAADPVRLQNGSTPTDRLRRAGWTPHGVWGTAENIAWGSGPRATPRSIVSSWMHSAGHRANVLDRRMRVIGVGIAPGAPQARLTGAGTYVADLAYGG